MNQTPWLTLVLLTPLGMALLLQAVPRRAGGAIRALTVVGTLLTAGMVAGLLVGFDRNLAGEIAASGLPHGPITFQFQEYQQWIPAIGAGYHLGIDGLSSWLLALTAGLFAIAALATARRASMERLKLYCSLLLLTETMINGVLLSVDLLLFYVFWEGMLIPLYLLLSQYGDVRLRTRATIKFIIYTVAGSLLMLIAILYVHFLSPANSFDLNVLLLNPGAPSKLALGFSSAQLAFIAFALAFAIKMPLVPFHTWLPDAYASATPETLTFFAGIVSKMGAFGFIRYAITLFPGPAHDYQFVIAAIAVVSIVYSALLALSERDVKRVVAYSSISHLGFIGLGIFALNANGINGAIIQMVNHGVIIAALFLIVGAVEARTGTRDLGEISGLERRMPYLYALFLIATLAGLGMPGMNSFVGEFTILLGAFQANPALTAFAGAGIVLACWYMLRLHQGLFHDPPSPRVEGVRDIRLGEGLLLAPLVAVMLLLGVFPKPVGDVTQQSAAEYVGAATAPAIAATAREVPCISATSASARCGR